MIKVYICGAYNIIVYLSEIRKQYHHESSAKTKNMEQKRIDVKLNMDRSKKKRNHKLISILCFSEHVELCIVLESHLLICILYVYTNNN